MRKLVFVLILFVIHGCADHEIYTATYTVNCNKCDISHSSSTGEMLYEYDVSGPWQRTINFSSGQGGAALYLSARYTSHKHDFTADTVRVSISLNGKEKAYKEDSGHFFDTTVLLTIPE